MNSFSKIYILLMLFSISLTIIVTSNLGFDLEDLNEAAYFTVSVVAIFFIIRLNIKELTIGWGIFVVGTTLDFIDNFIEQPDFVDVYLEEPSMLLGIIIFVYGFYIATKRKEKLNKELEFLSYHDSMTGLYNRTYFDKIVKKMDRIENIPISVIIADLNNLKKVNDNYGHLAGNELIKEAANVLKSVCSENDILFRSCYCNRLSHKKIT